MIMLSQRLEFGVRSSSQVPVADVLGIAQGHECDAVGCEIYEHITYLAGRWRQLVMMRHGRGSAAQSEFTIPYRISRIGG